MEKGQGLTLASDASPLRPSKSVVRKALRDMVRPVVSGLVVVELYAGTGLVSKELIEEGASRSFAVDRRERPDKLPEEVEWFQRDVDQFLRHGPPEPVGLVFLDPPYNNADYESLITRIVESEWFKEHGIIAVETSRDTTLPPAGSLADDMVLKRNRRYGNTRLWIYQHDPDQ